MTDYTHYTCFARLWKHSYVFFIFSHFFFFFINCSPYEKWKVHIVLRFIESTAIIWAPCPKRPTRHFQRSKAFDCLAGCIAPTNQDTQPIQWNLWACKAVSQRYRIILKTFILPKAIPFPITRTQWKFLPCRSSDRHYWLRMLPISSEHALDGMLKRHRNNSCTFTQAFCIKKRCDL